MCVSPFLPPYYARPGRKAGTLLSPAFGDETHIFRAETVKGGASMPQLDAAHDPGRMAAPSMRHQPRVTMVLVQIT